MDANEFKGKAWNEHITPRLEAILSWYGSPSWREGVARYFDALLTSLQKQLDYGCETQREEDKLRGRIIMLRELLEMPATLERTIHIAEQEKNRPKPSGDAGY